MIAVIKQGEMLRGKETRSYGEKQIENQEWHRAWEHEIRGAMQYMSFFSFNNKIFIENIKKMQQYWQYWQY